jgi:hypothetical protein
LEARVIAAEERVVTSKDEARRLRASLQLSERDVSMHKVKIIQLQDWQKEEQVRILPTTSYQLGYKLYTTEHLKP